MNRKIIIEPTVVKPLFMFFLVIQVSVGIYFFHDIINEIKTMSPFPWFPLLFIPFEIVILIFFYFGLFVMSGIKVDDTRVYVYDLFRWKELSVHKITDVEVEMGAIVIKAPGSNLFNKYVVPCYLSPADKIDIARDLLNLMESQMPSRK